MYTIFLIGRANRVLNAASFDTLEAALEWPAEKNYHRLNLKRYTFTVVEHDAPESTRPDPTLMLLYSAFMPR